jgi:hypothetical protein
MSLLPVNLRTKTLASSDEVMQNFESLETAITQFVLPAGTDAAKIADGSISNAEFQFLDGVASNIQAQLNALVSALDGKAASTHAHSAGDVADFGEAVDDRVATLLQAGDNISLSYNDATDRFVIAATGNLAATLARDTASVATSVLANNAADNTKTLALGRAAYVLQLQTSAAAWVRLYATAAYRAADAARSITQDPNGEHGLLLEIVTTVGNLIYDLAPMVLVANLEAVPVPDMALSVVNLSGVSQAITVTARKITAQI